MAGETMSVLRALDYKVIILDPDPEDAEKQLAKLSKDGWSVISSYCEDRVILTRFPERKP